LKTQKEIINKMEMNCSDLIIIRDYLKWALCIKGIDNQVGYNDGVLETVVNGITKSLGSIKIELKETK